MLIDPLLETIAAKQVRAFCQFRLASDDVDIADLAYELVRLVGGNRHHWEKTFKIRKQSIWRGCPPGIMAADDKAMISSSLDEKSQQPEKSHSHCKILCQNSTSAKS